MSTLEPEVEPDELHRRVAEALEAFEQGGAEALERICAEHPSLADALRKRVRGLAALGLLDESSATDASLPERLGDFVPLQRLGGGGMGVVFLARQESLGREVALKLIRADQLHLPGARERFRREVETVARLQHPGIVPVYAVGEERGVPFLAMELVAGRNLAEVVAELSSRAPAALTGADLAHAVGGDAQAAGWVFAGGYAEACARIVRQAAEALEHAHRRGVTHRDLKPSNVMLTPDGRAQLVDFGLSSFEGSSKLTHTGSQLGSLAYMAPEHLRGTAPGSDPRIDVYGLGVTLYEMLALRSPFACESREATRTAVLSADPPRLSQLNSSVSWELETVCMKAMDVEPGRRYATAADLARDLGNVLEQRPIEARRAGAWLRAKRWVQRHPTASVAAVAGVLVLLVGPSVFAVQQSRARGRLQLALEETEAERARAEVNLASALSAVDVMLARVGDRTLRQVPQMDVVRRGLLEDALAFYEDLLAQREGQASSLDELELRLKLAQLEIDFGEDAAAEARLADLLERVERAPLPREPDGDQAYLRGRVLNSLAGLRFYGPASAEALEDLRSAARILLDCATGPRATNGRRTTAAIALANLGTALWQEERPREQVLEVLDDARELRLQLAGQDSDSVNQTVELACVDSMRARCLLELGRHAESRAVVESAVAALRKEIASSPSGRYVRLRIVAAASGLTYLLDNAGDVESSNALLEAALPLSEALIRDFPEYTEYVQEGMVLAVNLAGGLSDVGRLEEAEALLRRRLAEAEGLLAAGSAIAGLEYLVAAGRTNLAEVLLDRGDLEAARIEAEAAVAASRALASGGGPATARREMGKNLGSALIVRATVQARDGAHARAVDDLKEAELLVVATDPRDQFETAKAWMLCGAAVAGDAALSEDALAARLDECYGHALAALAHAIDAGWTDATHLREDALWEDLRGLPEFEALLERLKPEN